MVACLQQLQQDLNKKIQSMSNWAEILDRVSLETTYGLLLTDKGKNTVEVWKFLLGDLEEIRQLSGKINNHPQALLTDASIVYPNSIIPV